ncbi:Plasmid stabilization system [Nitrosotalea sinensis]|uniref:Plasmid stabilization system n=1 Tax=Nitrosotalea sinensis TaxID=1499975 RepID=A0A2H1EFI0_9ARCH|nr:type II toxin-antitoxin system RelE/ParE family toxin [Candidatus Nitrosotalea sinensis]SHO42794.1 Plasmid stabilization system [Candidatus Nitrosotalea sinensis]
MVIQQIVWSDKFKKEVTKIKDNKLKGTLQKQIQNLVECPELGKPLRYNLKGERTVYVKPYRLIYAYDGAILYLLRFEHRKKVYRK